MILNENDKAPEFSLLNQHGDLVSLADFLGKKVVLYFYPKDDTPGCTTEACNFNESLKVFENLNAVVIGISRDTVLSHNKFVGKYSLGFFLLSDEDGSICEAYGVWGEKSMYGKTYFGIKRTTFLIDETGVIKKIWPNVKVSGHREEVIESLKENFE